MRVLVAALMAFVAAFLLIPIAGLVVGGGEQGGQIGAYVAIVGYFVFIVLWVRNSQSTRQTFRRSLLTVAVESFALPLVGLVFTAIFTGSNAKTGAEVVGGLIGGGLATATLGCIGFALGIFCLVLYLALRAEPQSRPAAQA